MIKNGVGYYLTGGFFFPGPQPPSIFWLLLHCIFAPLRLDPPSSESNRAPSPMAPPKSSHGAAKKIASACAAALGSGSGSRTPAAQSSSVPVKKPSQFAKKTATSTVNNQVSISHSVITLSSSGGPN